MLTKFAKENAISGIIEVEFLFPFNLIIINYNNTFHLCRTSVVTFTTLTATKGNFVVFSPQPSVKRFMQHVKASLNFQHFTTAKMHIKHYFKRQQMPHE